MSQFTEGENILHKKVIVVLHKQHRCWCYLIWKYMESVKSFGATRDAPVHNVTPTYK